MPQDFDYARVVTLSERVSWKLDDVIPRDATLDFSRRFLPESFMGEAPLLTGDARRLFNQIRGNSYLNLLGFVEEYIIATAVQHANAELFGDRDALRALLRFGDEELKHQQMFERFTDAFRRGFPVRCDVVGAAEEVAGFVLKKSPLAVMLVTLHLELVTQLHYVESVREADDMDPLVRKLLEAHWLEESQHAKIDLLEIDRMAAAAGKAALQRALDDYRDIVLALDGVLGGQAKMDVGNLARALGKRLTREQSAAFETAQHGAYRRLFLQAGLDHPTFRARIGALLPSAGLHLDETAARLSAVT